MPVDNMQTSTDERALEFAATYDISTDVARELARYHFDSAGFDARRAELAANGIDISSNFVTGNLRAPTLDELTALPPSGSTERQQLAALGAEAIRSGHVGVVLLAGGMATRFGGGVKALAEVLPGLRFVDVKIRDLGRAAADFGAMIPMILMTSFQSEPALSAVADELSTELGSIRTAPQNMSLRVMPTGELHRGPDGSVSPYAPGHGDLGDALRRSGALGDFISSGGKHLFVTNVDNTGATLDAAMVGLHLSGSNPLTCEVTPSAPGVVGGAPYFLDEHLQILEDFRVPDHDRPGQLAVINTNSLTIDADRLTTPHPLTWFVVEKTVDGQPVVQFERLVGELSANMATTMALVDSDGLDGRFQPVKDPAELERRRPAIREILRARNIID